MADTPTTISTLRAGLCALVMGLAPQTGVAGSDAVDLSDLRAALRAVEADLSGNITAPVDVPALWSKLPLSETPDVTAPAKAEQAMPAKMAKPTAPKAAPAAASPFGKTPTPAAAPAQPAARSVLAPAPTNNASPSQNGGLFERQMAQTTVVAPTLAPLPAPKFKAQSPFAQAPAQAPKTAITSARVPAASAQVPNAPAPAKQDVVVANFRLMLASLSQTYTGRNSMAVVNAQGPRGPVALSLRAGNLTLKELLAHANTLGHGLRGDGALSIPIVVWPEATLRLTPSDHLKLARDAGAFVLVMGTLEADGATIERVGPKNIHTPSFEPFVTVAGGGSLTLENATLRHLGFGHTAKFSGLSVAGNLLNQGKGKAVVRNTLFDGIKRVSIAGTTKAQIIGNTFVNPTDTTLHLINATEARIENNLFFDGSHTNALRIESGSIRTQVTRNIFLSGQRVALLVQGRSDQVRVRENIIWKRQGAGIKLLQTRCALVENNFILDNLQKGVEVRKSDGTVVARNVIAGNRNAAIWVSAQGRDAQTAVQSNVLEGNGSGLAAATGAEIFLSGNSFARQLPKLLEGDISQLARQIIVDLDGTEPVRFKSGKADQQPLDRALCGSVL